MTCVRVSYVISYLFGCDEKKSFGGSGLLPCGKILKWLNWLHIDISASMRRVNR